MITVNGLDLSCAALRCVALRFSNMVSYAAHLQSIDPQIRCLVGDAEYSASHVVWSFLSEFLTFSGHNRLQSPRTTSLKLRLNFSGHRRVVQHSNHNRRIFVTATAGALLTWRLEIIQHAVGLCEGGKVRQNGGVSSNSENETKTTKAQAQRWETNNS